MREKLCHVYYKPGQYKGCAYMFRFSVASPVLRDPYVLGRPIGVFNAECWGTTFSDDPAYEKMKREKPFAVRPLIDRTSVDGANRFPMADCFPGRIEAALECDLWKLRLLRLYCLEIPFSCGSLQHFLNTALAVGLAPTEKISESTWSEEFKDFIETHRAVLEAHREAAKPELDIDGTEAWGRAHSRQDLVEWAIRTRIAKEDLDAFNSTGPALEIQKLRTLRRYISQLLDVRIPNVDASVCNFALKQHIQSLKPALLICELQDKRLSDQKILLEKTFEELKSNRPPITT